jgi:hypothetical protein
MDPERAIKQLCVDWDQCYNLQKSAIKLAKFWGEITNSPTTYVMELWRSALFD